jgi:hypothetical protein
MDEAESRRMKTDPSERISATSIRAIADDRMPTGGQLGPELAAAAGHEG